MKEALKQQILNDAQWSSFIERADHEKVLRISVEDIDFYLINMQSRRGASLITTVMTSSIPAANAKSEIVESFQKAAEEAFNQSIKKFS
ncbi:MAG: hypothetical protein HDS89_06175 [Bacteroidales bacterium]|nr:hypothetical protein [Bacteroidales bacterium]